MKNASGKILIVLFLLCSIHVFADDPTPTPLVNETACEGAVGFMSAVLYGNWNTYTFVIVKGSNGVYWAKARILASGLMGYSSYQITWSETQQWWQAISVNPPEIDSCASDWYNHVVGLTDEERLNPENVYDDYFPEEPPESRLPMDDDLDGDGMMDYYDLDCPAYADYLAYCEASNVEPLDMVDYLYWYQNDIADWLGERMNITDTDGDGFSDGYETVHGTEVYDGSDYPLGVPDTGSSLLVVGGVESQEPWRLEEYNDSGYSRGYVYDQGYDPFGSETLSFEDDPDWGLLDSDNDGLVNYAESANGTDPYRFEFQSGFSYAYDEAGGFYYVTGYTEDGAFGDYGTAPTEEEWLESHEDYGVGDYAFNPSEYEFGDTKYDGLLDKTGKIKFDCDNVRPQTQRDYKLHFNLPIPGAGMQTFTISVIPDQSSPAGAAMEIVRQLVRGISGVIFSYVFVKHVWLTIRQY